jgi:predicted metallopeptidase
MKILEVPRECDRVLKNVDKLKIKMQEINSIPEGCRSSVLNQTASNKRSRRITATITRIVRFSLRTGLRVVDAVDKIERENPV